MRDKNDKKQLRMGRGTTGWRRKETRQKSNKSGKQTQKLEFENGQDMETNGPVFCVEDRRLAAHRRLPLSAIASQKKQEWRYSGEATKEGKRGEWVGEGTGGRGRGLGFGDWVGGSLGTTVGGSPYRQPRSIEGRDFTAGPWG